mgnify:FL=1
MKKIFKTGLKKSRENIIKAFSFLSGKSNFNESDISDFEDFLISSDIDLDTVDFIIKEIRNNAEKDISLSDSVKNGIKKSIPEVALGDPSKVTMLVGVNGTGKTTFCAKYSKYLIDNKKKVLLVAADTYRAAAYEQIQYWSSKYKIECVANSEKKDPSSVIFDALNSKAAKAADKIIIDSAGRLHSSVNLMKELKKMSNVIQKFDFGSQNLISVDAITGKNALNQVKLFNEYLKIDGIVLNKMDGTARGGIAISILKKYKIPICFLGLGEKIEDIAPFDIDAFLDNLVGQNEKN